MQIFFLIFENHCIWIISAWSVYLVFIFICRPWIKILSKK